MSKNITRNVNVEAAVDLAITSIDYFLEGNKLKIIPNAAARSVLDYQINHTSGSVRLASLFFSHYAMIDIRWNFDSIPTGIRGTYGDKRLSKLLNIRNITLHKSVTAFGENLGWKGNVSNSRLSSDPRFEKLFSLLNSSSREELSSYANYFSAKFADSRKIVSPLPPVSDDVLTFSRSKKLFGDLIKCPSEGNIQQFSVAAFLFVHRKRFAHEVRTHHVHASDKYDSTSGDIEEYFNGELVRAYEVTVRPDWKNRVGDLREKMDSFGLKKYSLIASNVNNDQDLNTATSLIDFLNPYGRDIAVVDINDFVNVFCMELNAQELREVITLTYDYLLNPKLCGRHDIIEKFSAIVDGWLDTAST